VFFVTGSSRGLGRAIVESGLAADHRVVATARNPRDLDDLVARHGDRILALPLDVTDSVAAALALEAAVNVFGRIDVLVNNAGQADRVALEDTTIEAFRRQVETNFLGTVYMTRRYG
jgi:NAD(P)-dependent dehydrogenase (short-subunit alcohol dehydrogenase family)